ncbi:MAG TPA: hypothetical protein RMH99_18495 [Sandaracinaceae bacterium LLY-WYZ-13_1]|nr:hypothetical protein [Sandaracinaceae bacterium LLY-WYZ-13_1]
MLPAYIIEELKRREEARREETSRPRPQLEVELPVDPGAPRREEPEVDRGVTIIQVG